jgi:hypothetical protein
MLAAQLTNGGNLIADPKRSVLDLAFQRVRYFQIQR